MTCWKGNLQIDFLLSKKHTVKMCCSAKSLIPKTVKQISIYMQLVPESKHLNQGIWKTTTAASHFSTFRLRQLQSDNQVE